MTKLNIVFVECYSIFTFLLGLCRVISRSNTNKFPSFEQGTALKPNRHVILFLFATASCCPVLLLRIHQTQVWVEDSHQTYAILGFSWGLYLSAVRTG